MLENYRQVQITRGKLRGLEEEYERARTDTTVSEHVRELTLRSLKKLINQLKEEITRFECHATVRKQ